MAADRAARAATILDIDLGAIAANWRLLAARAKPAQCAAVVKANAYGLGAARVAPALAAAGCCLFFVATLDEAIALRAVLGRGVEIAVLNGPMQGTTGEFVEHGLVPVLNEPGQITEWAPYAVAAPCENERGGGSAILHIDTGMARLGLTAAQFAALADHPPPIRWRAVMSHLACADDPDHPLNPQQRRRFVAARAQLPGVPASLAASSGIFLGPAYHFNLVRPGAALCGVNPQPGQPNPLRPVVRLCAKILQIRQIDRGESVGYGATHVMQAPGRVATVAVGYADGWLRSLSHRGCGYLAGTRVPLLGRISMDLATFDVSAVDPTAAFPGAAIELIGAHYDVDAAAADAGTIGYEMLTALGARHYRVYHDTCPDNPAG
ncbi:MAG TPA: alanine racemase [Stellaceae bacterium]|jgi:alanine racemase|nr:alanine racemase [Stellaceae bacterium]